MLRLPSRVFPNLVRGSQVAQLASNGLLTPSIDWTLLGNFRYGVCHIAFIFVYTSIIIAILCCRLGACAGSCSFGCCINNYFCSSSACGDCSKSTRSSFEAWYHGESFSAFSCQPHVWQFALKTKKSDLVRLVMGSTHWIKGISTLLRKNLCIAIQLLQLSLVANLKTLHNTTI